MEQTIDINEYEATSFLMFTCCLYKCKNPNCKASSAMKVYRCMRTAVIEQWHQYCPLCGTKIDWKGVFDEKKGQAIFEKKGESS